MELLLQNGTNQIIGNNKFRLPRVETLISRAVYQQLYISNTVTSALHTSENKNNSDHDANIVRHVEK